jgi:hypothetical protein
MLSEKHLGTSQTMQRVDDGAPAHIEEIRAQTTGTGAPSLPVTHRSQRLLDGHPFAEFRPSLRSLLAFASFDEQGFIRMDADTAPFGTGGAWLFQRTLRARLCGKMDHATGHTGHLVLSWAPNDLPLPIEEKGVRGNMGAPAHRPRCARHLQIVAAFPHHMTPEIRPIDLQLVETHRLPREILADRVGDAGLPSQWLA